MWNNFSIFIFVEGCVSTKCLSTFPWMDDCNLKKKEEMEVFVLWLSSDSTWMTVLFFIVFRFPMYVHQDHIHEFHGQQCVFIALFSAAIFSQLSRPSQLQFPIYFCEGQKSIHESVNWKILSLMMAQSRGKCQLRASKVSKPRVKRMTKA